MSTVAAIRPDDVNLPLFLHVLGAMLLVGTLFGTALALELGRRAGEEGRGLTRMGLKTLLIGVFPAYVLMRVGAQWTEAQEDLPEEVEEQWWIGIGYITADLGALLVIISIVLSAIGLKKLRQGAHPGTARAVGIISIVMLVAYIVAVWAMSTKPV